MQVRKIIFHYSEPPEIKDEYLPDLELLGARFNKEDNSIEFIDLQRFVQFFSVWSQLHNIKSVEELRTYLASIVPRASQKKEKAKTK